MSQLVYCIDPLERSTKFWLKAVQAVHPERGNGFDIQGPFINNQGVLEEGTLLCSGENLSRLDGRTAVYYQAWKIMHREQANCFGCAWAYNCALLRSSGQIFRMEEMEAARKNYPELTPILHKPIAPVLWVLLIYLRAAAAATPARREAAKTPSRLITLED